MRSKIFLILIVSLGFFSYNPILIDAANQTSVIELQQKIQALQKEIKRLQLLLVDMRLKKELVSGSYLVMDVSDNAVISEKNTHQRYPIASLTKLMNAVIALEHIDADRTITLNEDMLKPLGYSPSLFLSSTVSAKNLLKASLIQSTNDASESLAYFIGTAKFVSLINQKAKELGMQDTYFYDAHGLSLSNQSTASDLAKLVTYIQKNHPEILEITKDNNFWLPDPSGKMLKFKNLNDFYRLPEFLGGKTGYLPEAKESLASVFNLEGKSVIVVLLYSKNRQADVAKIMRNLK